MNLVSLSFRPFQTFLSLETRVLQRRLHTPIKSITNKLFNQKCIKFSTSSTNSCNNNKDQPTEKWPDNRVNFKFHPEIQTLFHQQIHSEFNAFYCYLSMANYFGRVDVALPGCELFFTQMHQEEHAHALKLIDYLKMRGGFVCLHQVNVPKSQDWKSPLSALNAALNLEMAITEQLMALNTASQKFEDPVTSDYITTQFLAEQMKSVNEIGKLITSLSDIGDCSLARFIFDRDLLKQYSCKK